MPDPHQLMLTEALSVSAQSVYGRGGVLQERWNQSQAQAGIGREHAVEANQMQERTRHQGGQACSPAMDATTAMRPELSEYASTKFVRGPVFFGVMVILATEYNIIGHDHSHSVIGHWS